MKTIEEEIIKIENLRISPEKISILERQLEGQKKTLEKIKLERQKIMKEHYELEKKLAEIEGEHFIRGYIEKPSLPLIKIGAGLNGRPICEKHGAMIRYENDIWRCEICKTAVDLQDLLKFIREEFDGVVYVS